MRVLHSEILLKMIALEKILEREESSFNPVVDKIIDLKYCSHTPLPHFSSHFALFLFELSGVGCGVALLIDCSMEYNPCG